MLPRINLDRLQIFYLATKYRKFYRAAQEMGLDPSAATRYVQKLEEELGCQLFDRNGAGRFALTQQGEKLHEISERLFKIIAEIEPSLERVNNEMEGTLRLAIHPGISASVISNYLPEFLKLYPNISLEIIAEDNPVNVNIREADVLIRAWIPEEGSELVEKPLFKYRRGLYASEEYIKNYGMPKKFSDLKNHRLIAAVSNTPFRESVVNWHLSLGTDKPYAPYVVTNNNIFVYKLIDQGIGIGGWSPDLLTSIPSNWVLIFPEAKVPTVEIFFVYGKQFAGTRKIEVLYSFLHEKIAEHLMEKSMPLGDIL